MGLKPLASFRPERPVKVVYADLDGTLTGPGASLFAAIPDGTTARGANAVARLHGAGIQLVLVSGRTRRQAREAARMLGAAAHVAELGAFLVDGDEVVTNFGHGLTGAAGTPFEALTRSGAGGFLLERYAGRLEPHTPWALEPREATLLLRGLLDPAEATATLAAAGYGWLEVRDNGVARRPFPTLDLPEVHVYHVVPRGVGKAGAVAVHRSRRGLKREETVMVGDSPSDLEIAPEVGAVFVVANGAEPVEASGAADGLDNAFATPSPAGDGVAEVVEAILRPERTPQA
jgi:phosphoglycolate phosphatase-like HAD superfamily hydrolase